MEELGVEVKVKYLFGAVWLRRVVSDSAGNVGRRYGRAGASRQ